MKRKVFLLLTGILIGAAIAVGLSQLRIEVGSTARAAAPDTYKQLNLFGDVFERIRSDYVEVPDEAALIEAAINGMLSSLDPHSGYLNAAAMRDMNVQTRGEFGGLGIEVTMENGVVKVMAPIDDTPAAKAGLLTGDFIVAIDGDTVEGLTLDQAVKKMRGDVNTPIVLTIKRDAVEKPFDVRLVRAVIHIQTVRSREEGGDIGYVRITQFNEQTFEELDKSVKKIRADIPGDKLRGFVIDLRNNPGGLLDAAVAVSDAFLNRGEIVSTRGRHAEETKRFNARQGDLVGGLPVIVLINGGSASASEIVAGALQDHRRATVLGTRSFGKASVQTIIPLSAESGLRLTTARYYTPSGRSIQAKGIEPDIEVVSELPPELKDQFGEPRGEASLKGHLNGEGEEQSGSSGYVPPDPKDDKQLNTALDLLRGVQVNNAFPPDPNRGIPN
jgi:carboxyl-terminal processing protease